MTKTRRLSRRYQVDNGDVSVRIIVGEGQVGTSLVEVDGIEIASGGLARVRLGSGEELPGKTARVITTVTDVQRATNRTSVRYVLEGGSEQAIFDKEAEVENEGGSVQYIARFRFET